MSHNDSNIPPADREFNELFRAANSNQSGHAPSNSKLNSVRNNPTKANESVKHSDFFVSNISTKLICPRDNFYRSETVEVDVKFSGMAKGFTSDVQYNPNNYTWYVNSNSKHLIKIEPYSVNKNDQGTWVAGQTGSHKIVIRHIGNNCFEDEDAYIHCKYKDDFNETIGPQNGYNVELTHKIVCKALDFSSSAKPIYNGNRLPDICYDNELEQPERQTGMNNRSYNTARARDGRQLRSALRDDQDIILETSHIGGPSILARSLIDKVTINWEKFDPDSGEWIQMSMSDDKSYLPYRHNNFNIGQFEKWYVNNHNTDQYTTGKLNIQGLEATGKYRPRLDITGDVDNRFTCTIHGNSVDVWVYERIAPFTLQGQGWECVNQNAILNVIPQIQNRRSYRGDDDIKNKPIRYSLYKHTETGTTLVTYVVRNDNGESPFTFSISADGFYSVSASWATEVRRRLFYGDFVTKGFGTRWATDRIDTGKDSKDTSSTLGSWYNRAGYIRRTLTPPNGPAYLDMTWNNMCRNDANWNWSHVGVQDFSYRSYQVRAYHRDDSATAGTEASVEIHGWKEIGDVSSYNVKDIFVPRNTHGAKSLAWLDAKVMIRGDLSKIAPGDTSATCIGPSSRKYHEAIGCPHITPRMPTPILSATTTMSGRVDPTFRWSWERNTWNDEAKSFHDLRRTTRENWVHVSWKYADESDEDVNDHWRDEVEGWAGAKILGDGLWYAKVGDVRAFSSGKVYDRAVIVRYLLKTYYIGEKITCLSNSHRHIHRTIDPTRVYSYTPGAAVPAKFTKKVHYGEVFVADSKSIPEINGNIPWNTYASGIGWDMTSGMNVTTVHQSTTIAQFKNGRIDYRRADVVDDSNGPNAKVAPVNVYVYRDSKKLRTRSNIKQGDTTTYKEEAIVDTPPYTLTVQNAGYTTSYQLLSYWKSNTLSYERKVTK